MENNSEISDASLGPMRRVFLTQQEIEAARTVLSLLSGKPGESRPDLPPDRAIKVEQARRMLEFRGRRKAILDLQAEAPFAILLALYANESREPSIPLTRLTLLASVGMSSTLRWLEVLLADKLVERGEDPDDLRKTMLRLTPKGRAKLDELFGNAAAESSPIP